VKVNTAAVLERNIFYSITFQKETLDWSQSVGRVLMLRYAKKTTQNRTDMA
jgi:hypothetical protein